MVGNVRSGRPGLGDLLYCAGIVGMFIAIRTERRIQALRRRQRELVEEWGPGVARQKNQDEDKD